MKLFFVYKLYCLVDPRDNKIRYIGQTIQPIQKRFNRHICESSIPKNKKDSWIKSLSNKGLKPEIKLIATCCSANCLNTHEKLYIKYYNSIGNDLVNLDSGGRNGNTVHALTKEKMSKSKKEFWSNPENKLSQLYKQKEGKQRDSVRLKAFNQSHAKKHLHNPETREKATKGLREALNKECYKKNKSEEMKAYWSNIDDDKRKFIIEKMLLGSKQSVRLLEYCKSDVNKNNLRIEALKLRTKRAKPFYGYLNGVKIGEWTNLIDAERELGIKYTNIHAVLNHKARTAKGHIFIYKKPEIEKVRVFVSE